MENTEWENAGEPPGEHFGFRVEQPLFRFCEYPATPARRLRELLHVHARRHPATSEKWRKDEVNREVTRNFKLEL